MGGVDIADQYRSYLLTQLKTWRSWFPLFFWLLDQSIINAFLLCRSEFCNIKESIFTNHRQFRIRLAWNLVILGATMLQHQGLFKYPTYGMGYGNQNESTKSAQIGNYVTINYEFPQERLMSFLPHRCSVIPLNKRCHCQFCSLQKKKGLTQKNPAYTSTECVICYHSALCLDHFEAFHCPVRSSF